MTNLKLVILFSSSLVFVSSCPLVFVASYRQATAQVVAGLRKHRFLVFPK